MSTLALAFFPYEIFIPLFSLIKQNLWYAALFILMYSCIGIFFFGYYDSKYGRNEDDGGIICLFAFFLWPLFLIVKITIFILSIPYHIGMMLGSVIKGGL